MKKEHLIVVFYILYFAWLFSVVYMVRQPRILDYFTAFITLFYFVFLREPKDIMFFATGAALVTLLVLIPLSGGRFYLAGVLLKEIPLWLPLSWGTTFVALRKFYITIHDK